MLASLRNPLFLDLAFRLASKPNPEGLKDPEVPKGSEEPSSEDGGEGRKEGKGKGGT
jgi:hypothetical protein